MALDQVTAGNVMTVTAKFGAASSPSPDPTAVVCFTDPYGDEAFTTTSPDVTVGAVVIDGVTYVSGVTVTAEWDVPDDTVGGVYVVTTETAGSFIAADEKLVQVKARRHVHA
jgi:hypothetical protein